MNTLSHKGFKASIAFDEDDNILVGRILGINDVIGFHADSVAGLRAAFEESVEDYVDACKQVGKDPEKAYSGKLMLRVDPKTHSAVAMAAEMAGKSLNQWGEEVLAFAARRATGSNLLEDLRAIEDALRKELETGEARQETQLEDDGKNNHAQARLSA